MAQQRKRSRQSQRRTRGPRRCAILSPTGTPRLASLPLRLGPIFTHLYKYFYSFFTQRNAFERSISDQFIHQITLMRFDPKLADAKLMESSVLFPLFPSHSIDYIYLFLYIYNIIYIFHVDGYRLQDAPRWLTELILEPSNRQLIYALSRNHKYHSLFLPSSSSSLSPSLAISSPSQSPSPYLYPYPSPFYLYLHLPLLLPIPFPFHGHFPFLPLIISSVPLLALKFYH